MCNTSVRPSASVTWNTWSAASVSAGNSTLRGWASRTSAWSSQAAKSVMKALNNCLSGLSVSAMAPVPRTRAHQSSTRWRKCREDLCGRLWPGECRGSANAPSRRCTAISGEEVGSGAAPREKPQPRLATCLTTLRAAPWLLAGLRCQSPRRTSHRAAPEAVGRPRTGPGAATAG